MTMSSNSRIRNVTVSQSWCRRPAVTLLALVCSSAGMGTEPTDEGDLFSNPSWLCRRASPRPFRMPVPAANRPSRRRRLARPVDGVWQLAPLARALFAMPDRSGREPDRRNPPPTPDVERPTCAAESVDSAEQDSSPPTTKVRPRRSPMCRSRQARPWCLSALAMTRTSERARRRSRTKPFTWRRR